MSTIRGSLEPFPFPKLSFSQYWNDSSVKTTYGLASASESFGFDLVNYQAFWIEIGIA